MWEAAPRTGTQLLHCREAGGPALGPGGLLAGALRKGEEEREGGLERRGGSQLQETTPHVGGGEGSPQAALRVRGASRTSPSSLPSRSAVLGPFFSVGVNRGPSVGRGHGRWWGAKTQVPSFPWPSHLDDPAPLSPAVDPSPWVGGPQRPPGQRNPQPSQDLRHQHPPARRPAWLLPAEACGSYLPRPAAPAGQAHLHLGSSIYSQALWLAGLANIW